LGDGYGYLHGCRCLVITNWPMDFSGYSVSSAGDVNSDGYDDFLIGAIGNDLGGYDAGRTYLIKGKADPDWGEDFDLINADASYVGENQSDYSGCWVSAVGDVDGDSADDFLIGAYGNGHGGPMSGQSYLVPGTDRVGPTPTPTNTPLPTRTPEPTSTPQQHLPVVSARTLT